MTQKAPISAVDSFNLFEFYLWSIIGVGFLIAAVIRSKQRSASVVAGVMLILFGISDWIELSTGAWWKPWWLFVWKAVCVISFVALWVNAHRRRQAANKEDTSEGVADSMNQMR